MKKLLGRLLGKGVSAVRPTSTAILAAAGSSQRMGGENKLLLPLDGMPVLAHTLRAVDAAQSVDGDRDRGAGGGSADLRGAL